MDPGGVQRIVAAPDFQKTGRLHERRLAEAGDFLQLFARAERTVLGYGSRNTRRAVN